MNAMPLVSSLYQEQLSSGLRVVVAEDSTSPEAVVLVWYGAGARHESPGRSGLAHVIEHAAFEGSGSVTPGEHKTVIAACGGRANAATGQEWTMYFQRLPREAVDLALWLEADRMMPSPTLSPQLLAKQRAIVVGEKRQRYDNAPYGSWEQRLLALLYPPGNPYRHMVIGTDADVEAATVEDVTAFRRAYYTPANAVLVAAGAVNTGEVMRLASRYFARIPAGTAPCLPVVQAQPPPGPRHDDAYEHGPGMLAAGWLLPANDPRATAEIHAAEAALRILADGPCSRLHRRLIDTATPLACEIRTDFSFAGRLRGGPSPRGIHIYATPSGGIEPLRAALAEETQRLITAGPTPEEIRWARARARRENLETTASRLQLAMALAVLCGQFGDARLINARDEALAAISPEGVQQAATHWLRHGATVAFHPHEARS